MTRPAIKIYSYVVEVLVYNTTEVQNKGPRKALADRFLKFKVMARNCREAEHMGRELAKRGGETGELLAHASVLQCLTGCHHVELPAAT